MLLCSICTRNSSYISNCYNANITGKSSFNHVWNHLKLNFFKQVRSIAKSNKLLGMCPISSMHLEEVIRFLLIKENLTDHIISQASKYA